MEEKCGCAWANIDPEMKKYHDLEWGRPVHDDRLLFEFLILEGAQAGLSWKTVLLKRDAYRIAFDNFEPEKVAQYDDKKTKELMANAGIIRNWRKIDQPETRHTRALLRHHQQGIAGVQPHAHHVEFGH